jgi:hypothetical protein
VRQKTRALQRRQAETVQLTRVMQENVQLTRVTQEKNAGKNAERAASKKETRACSEVTT